MRDPYYKTRAYVHSLKKMVSMPMDRVTMRQTIETQVFGQSKYDKVLKPKEEDIIRHFEKYDPYKRLKLSAPLPDSIVPQEFSNLTSQ